MKKILVFICIIVMCSCATIMRDNYQPITINSSPEHVDIKIVNSDGLTVFEGSTPTTISLKTSKSGYFSPEKYTVYAKKDKYKDYQTSIDYRISNWYFFGNIVFGGLIGWLIVDPISGDMFYLEQKDAIINMSPKQ